jgi:kynurenine formamidase
MGLGRAEGPVPPVSDGQSWLRFLALVAVPISCACAASGSRCAQLPAHLVDLSHTLSPDFPFIPVQGKTFAFRITPIATLADNGVNANKWELTEHNGTHLDAPLHFAADGVAIDQIPIAALFVPAAVIDLHERAAHDPDAHLRVEDVLQWESVHGRLPDGAALFVFTGWDARAVDPTAFLNLDANGTMHFPGVDEATVAFLVAERRIVGVGIDTLSIDPGIDKQYAAHRKLFGAGKWAAECVANLGQLPATGATVFVGAAKVRGATGAPARIVAFW